VVANKEDRNRFHLRWLTPSVEVPLCGHATLASAHILFTEKFPGITNIDKDLLTFDTLSGPLTVERLKDSECLQMNFPLRKPVEVKLAEQILQQLIENLSLSNKEDIIEIQFSEVAKKLLVEVKSAQLLKNLHPNMEGLLKMKFGDLNVMGIIATSTAAGEAKHYDFLSRYFTPWNGIPEDPVTGSAHTVLAPYWSNKLKKTKMNAFQASARGGDLLVEVLSNDRVLINGTSFTTLSGTLRV